MLFDRLIFAALAATVIVLVAAFWYDVTQPLAYYDTMQGDY